jgi:hypothetical protein
LVDNSVNELNWHYIALSSTFPAIAALLVAYPFWRLGHEIFGSIVGTAVIFGSAIGFIMRESVELDRITQACLDAGTVCWPEPSAFTRFAIYGFIGLTQVIVLFTVSMIVEQRVRRRSYSREWR